MARISVYVPDSMKERMDALGERVNWSEAAQAAFDREITIATIPKDPNMNQVVERLRASKTEFEQAQAAEGRKHGREWAKMHASYNQLRALSKLELKGDDFAPQFDRALGPTEDRHDSFWYDPTLDDYLPPSDEYVQAYLDGCHDIWNEVEKQL